MTDAVTDLGTVAAAILRRVKTLTWRLRPATVVKIDALSGTPWVLFDGESTAVPVSSLIGPLTPAGRVMVAFVPPGGSYAIGWIGPPSTGGGPEAVDSYETNSAAIGTTAVAVCSVPVTFKAWTAYRVTIGGGVIGSAVGNLADLRLRKAGTTPVAITEFYRWRTEGTPVMNADAVRYLRRDAGTDLSITLELTLQASAGTVTHIGGAGRPRYLEVHRAGHAAFFPHATAVI